MKLKKHTARWPCNTIPIATRVIKLPKKNLKEAAKHEILVMLIKKACTTVMGMRV